jgi:hypothetical protein
MRKNLKIAMFTVLVCCSIASSIYLHTRPTFVSPHSSLAELHLSMSSMNPEDRPHNLEVLISVIFKSIVF